MKRDKFTIGLWSLDLNYCLFERCDRKIKASPHFIRHMICPLRNEPWTGGGKVVASLQET